MADITSIELPVEKKGGRKHHLLSVLVLLLHHPQLAASYCPAAGFRLSKHRDLDREQSPPLVNGQY